MQFVDHKGWAVGTRGVIIFTADEGKHWERLPFSGDVTFNDLCFINDREGWVAGEFNYYNWFSGVSLTEEGRGLIVGGGGTIKRTEDGGKKWQ